MYKHHHLSYPCLPQANIIEVIREDLAPVYQEVLGCRSMVLALVDISMDISIDLSIELYMIIVDFNIYA